VKSVYHDLQTYLLNASQLLLNQLLSNVTDVEINKASSNQTLFVYHATMHDACHDAASVVVDLQCYTLTPVHRQGRYESYHNTPCH